MRLTCLQKDFATALSITNKAVGVNNTLPVLNNVLVKAEGKKLYFTTTDLEIAISYWIEADIQNEGEITIPSKLLTNYVNYLKDDKVDVSVEEGDAVMIKTADSKTKIKGISANEFPAIPAVEKEGAFTITTKDLNSAINQVAFAAALNTTRPILTGVYFNIIKNELKMVATDSYRLAEKTIKVADVAGDISCIVPVKTMLEIGTILSSFKSDHKIEVIVSKNQIFFSADKTKITSRLIEGQFPNYQQVIPKDSKTKITLNVPELSLVLKRINLFARENNNKILLKVSSSGMMVTTDTTQYGVGEVDIKTKTEGEKNEIALNSQFLLEVLGSVGASEVIIELGEKTSPAIVRIGGKDDYIHIIMPLKI
ncbi:DNA polymerase III subunit beta [Candidatus Peregrinibacteria bacterium]|nr:DNA polymerase III subunit beta [Candidatus Peregrinibacteria bacterium]